MARALALILLSVLFAGCATAAPIAMGPAYPLAAPSAGLSDPGQPSQSPGQPTPLPAPSSSIPDLVPSPPPVHLVGADWPATVRSTPDPGFSLRVPVLMYHRIVAPADAGPSLPGLVIDPILFAQQMSLLATAGWHTITLATLQADLARGRRPAPRTFVITIDDGHTDGVTNALPILRRFGFVATYFVVMGRIHNSNYLSPADLRTLADAGMEIADHTMDHHNVARLHGAALAHDINAAAGLIRQITGRAPTTFAYPAGEWSLEAVGAVEADNLGMAVTTQEGVLETWANRFLVPRLRVTPSQTAMDLLRRLSGYALD